MTPVEKRTTPTSMLVLGHRGAPRQAPENSLEAFSLALACGADGVELDVRMTVDGALVLRHDDTFESGGTVASLTLEDVLRLEPHTPGLDVALDVLRTGVCVVEMKTQPGRNERFCDAVAAVLETREQMLIVSSFDPAVLRSMRSRLPALATGLLVGRLAGEEQASAFVDEAVQAGHVQLHVERRILLGPHGDLMLRLAQRAGLEVVAWTVNDSADARALRADGCTGIISDVPDVMVAVRAQDWRA